MFILVQCSKIHTKTNKTDKKKVNNKRKTISHLSFLLHRFVMALVYKYYKKRQNK